MEIGSCMILNGIKPKDKTFTSPKMLCSNFKRSPIIVDFFYGEVSSCGWILDVHQQD